MLSLSLLFSRRTRVYVTAKRHFVVVPAIAVAARRCRRRDVPCDCWYAFEDGGEAVAADVTYRAGIDDDDDDVAESNSRALCSPRTDEINSKEEKTKKRK